MSHALDLLVGHYEEGIRRCGMDCEDELAYSSAAEDLEHFLW